MGRDKGVVPVSGTTLFAVPVGSEREEDGLVEKEAERGGTGVRVSGEEFYQGV